MEFATPGPDNLRDSATIPSGEIPMVIAEQPLVGQNQAVNATIPPVFVPITHPAGDSSVTIPQLGATEPSPILSLEVSGKSIKKAGVSKSDTWQGSFSALRSVKAA